MRHLIKPYATGPAVESRDRCIGPHAAGASMPEGEMLSAGKPCPLDYGTWTLPAEKAF